MVDPVISSSQRASGNTTNLANSSLTTNFNVVPYYDDYDPNKNFYRILFKPGYAVQARELTQIQSMVQSQISRFGRHVFKDGSIVLPGGFTLRVNVGRQKGNPIDYVKLKDVDTSNNTIDVKSFVGQTVVGATSNITAYVVDVAESDGTAANSATLYVTYISASSSNSQQRVFIAGETLTTPNAEICIVKNNDPIANTGYASWFQIEEGVYFAKEHFIHFPTQSIILDRYNPNPSCKVGFQVSEEIISAAQDATLLDPALESSNYSAPGADRFKLLSTLTVLPFEDTSGLPDFVTLFSIKDGVIQLTNDRADYNQLGDSLAYRTYEESGDYVVRGLNVQIKEHDRITSPIDNFGEFANGDNKLLAISVDPGLAFVQGYAAYIRDRTTVAVQKPLNYENVENQISSTGMGQYLRVTEVVGSWQLDQGARINFYDTVQKRITANGNTTTQQWSSGAQSGNNIGSAIVHSVQYVSGTPGYDAIYDIYLSDVTMLGSNSVSTIRSLFYPNSPHSNVGADVFGADNTTTNTTFNAVNQSPLLYYVGSNYTKTTRDVQGNPQTIYYYSKTDGIASSLVVSSTGVLTFTPSLPTNDRLPYGNTTLSSTDVSQDIILTMNRTFNIGPLFSAATVSASGRTITGVGTSFTRLNVGDKITIAGQANATYYITAIANNTSMTVSNTVPSSVTGNVIFKAYKTGDIINLNGKGVNAGAARTVSATPTSFTIDLKESLGADREVTITYKVASTASAEKIKTLRPNRYVSINCATAGTEGPFNLGFSDVYRIRNVIKKTGSKPTSLSDGTNVTRYFTLDNGQKDTFYDLAKLFKNSSIALDPTDNLLVELDYFQTTTTGKAGFYTIDSYPIEDNDANSSNSTIRTENIPIYTSPTTRVSYDLRNHIDFRPAKTNTANDATTIAVATENPSNTSLTYSFAATGMKFAVPSTEITYDYSYYLGRKDIVSLSKQSTIVVTKGVPSTNPILPESLETHMLLATLDIAPYPSLSPAYANVLKRKDLSCSSKKVSNRRYTMRDIGTLDDRIKNLEYYTTLTLLEKDALSLKILDESGLDRFKNGIFVDTFRDTTLTAAGIDPDYRIVTDPIELSIRPMFSTESVPYNTISTSGVVVKNGVAMLSYTETEYLNQTDVTDSRNIERGNYNFVGVLTITPNQDVWVDTSQVPDELVEITSKEGILEIDTNNPGDDSAVVIRKNGLNAVWENWQRTITGYNLYRGEGANRVLIGTYATEAQARAQAAQWTTSQNGGSATLETLFLNSRKGTNYFSNSGTDTAVGSNKLISSEIVPYIRSQTIAVAARNVKPYSKMNAFFDNVNVSEYCTPLTEDEYKRIASGQPVSGLPAPGGDLIVQNDGTLYFAFNIPAGRFRTGAKKLVILDGKQIDPTQLSEERDASTLAAGDFFADGTKQVFQRTIYTTKGFSTTSESTFESNRNTSSSLLPNTWTPPPPPPPPPPVPDNPNVPIEPTPPPTPEELAEREAEHWRRVAEIRETLLSIGVDWNDCSAYTVFVKLPDTEEGMFCTGFDFFVQRKSQTRGLWVEVREIDNTGNITPTRIPGSVKIYTNSEIPVSSDGITNPMRVKFDSPIFLFNNTDYAFVIHSDSPAGSTIDPDTSIWIARTGEKDLNTGKPYNDRQRRGKFYSTTNNRKWDLIEDVDIPIRIYRANFTTTAGSIVIGNKTVEKLILKNVSSSFSGKVNDFFVSGDTITLTPANGTNTINLSDRFYGGLSAETANGYVISIDGSSYLLSNTGYQVGEKIDVYDQNGQYKGITADVVSAANSTAKLTYYDDSFNNVYSEYVFSTGGFRQNTIIRSISYGGEAYHAEVDYVGDYRYSAISFEPKVLNFTKTDIVYQMKTVANGTSSFDQYRTIFPSETTYFDNEKVLLGRSNEVSNLNGESSNQVRVTLRSSSTYLSPVFDLDASHAIYIDNLINDDTTGETNASGGKAINKYISQTIILADGQDAEDLRVFLTAYRPPNTDVLVYAKMLNNNDTDTFAQKLWTPMEKMNDGDLSYSSLSDRQNFKEYTYKLPNSVLTGSMGEYQYTSGSTTFTGFKYFAIKIVLTSTNSAIIPRVADLRAIALQI